ncbi:glycosyltransferase [Mycolicibacterium sp. Dal123E01]|uniref:glycosyltransferase n=1 Tax=Mycolicibacterium sp. Dal123E01 TaxID=3457578 RepID=UPI00403E84A7
MASGQEIAEVRVLVTIPSLVEPGGAEFVASEWARYLAQVGDSVTVYITHPEPGDVAPDGVLLVKARKSGFVAQTRELAQYLKSQPVDVVLSLMPYCNLMSVAAVRSLGRNRPKVVISGRTLAQGWRNQSGGSYSRQQWLARRAYQYADLFVAISHPVGAEAIPLYGLSWDRVTVIPNPAFAKTQNRPVVTERPSINVSHVDLVLPARLVPEKQPLVAVDVAAALSTDFADGVTLHIFGVGPLADAITSRAKEAGVDLVMHGWVQDWFDECPPGSIVLLTSVVEGFGNVLVEAAAAGFRSIVSSRCLGAADAMVPGLTGELIANDSAEDYVAAVRAISREPVSGIETWLQRFTSEGSGRVLREALVRVNNGIGEAVS